LTDAVSSTRIRILGWYMALLALAVVIGLLLQRGILLSEFNTEVNAQLRQEVEEIKQLSTGHNPLTGEPFGQDVEALFDTFLRRNIPVENEALFTLVDGRAYKSTTTPLQLLEDEKVVAEWAAVMQPTQGELDTSEGKVRYLATPVLAEDGQGGTFIVASFLNQERGEIDRVLIDGGIVFGSVFVIASVIAWFAAGRILTPVRLLTTAANSITDSNLAERIPVKGSDEMAGLTRTFNDMLDRLEGSFRTQRRLIDDAGHELRTPITIIRGHFELMGDEPQEREETKRLVMEELDRMSRIVDDLLLLATTEQPNFLDLHPLDVAELTEEFAARASAFSPTRQWIKSETANVVINADRERLTQALMNLARNAVEHSPDGSRITVGSRLAAGQVQIFVRDQGDGIPVADHKRIFDRFARGRGQRRSEGAGLGLSIVKAIIESHGGSVGVESAPGRGSTFTIELPVQLSEDAW
jgi:signal transduction histidine kinase